MGFEACHPAVNFIFFAAAIYGASSIRYFWLSPMSALLSTASSAAASGR